MAVFRATPGGDIEDGETQRSIARSYNVSQATIARLLLSSVHAAHICSEGEKAATSVSIDNNVKSYC